MLFNIGNIMLSQDQMEVIKCAYLTFENIDKNILSNKYTERKAIKSIKKDIFPIVPTEVFKSDDNIILNLNSQFDMIKKEYLE